MLQFLLQCAAQNFQCWQNAKWECQKSLIIRCVIRVICSVKVKRKEWRGWEGGLFQVTAWSFRERSSSGPRRAAILRQTKSTSICRSCCDHSQQCCSILVGPEIFESSTKGSSRADSISRQEEKEIFRRGRSSSRSPVNGGRRFAASYQPQDDAFGADHSGPAGPLAQVCSGSSGDRGGRPRWWRWARNAEPGCNARCPPSVDALYAGRRSGCGRDDHYHGGRAERRAEPGWGADRSRGCIADVHGAANRRCRVLIECDN